MKVTVEKLDDINYIMSGTVENSVIEKKVASLKTEAAKAEKKDDAVEENLEKDAAGQVFQDFINEGIKEAQLDEKCCIGRYEVGSHLNLSST